MNSPLKSPVIMTRFQRQNAFALEAQRTAKRRNCAPFATRRQLKQLVDISGFKRVKKIHAWLRVQQRLAAYSALSFAR